jgi:glycosyltransferase involved in cell wall biosynthesis
VLSWRRALPEGRWGRLAPVNSSTIPRKILLVTDYGTPTGGDELLTIDLRDALRARGHDARLFSSDARPLSVPIAADYTCRGTTSRWRTLLQSANPFAAASFRRVLEQFDPDVVHVRSFLTQLSPLILPLLSGRPSILHLDTLRAICPSGSKLLPGGDTCRVSRGIVCRREGCIPTRDWLVLTPQMRASDRWIDRYFDLRIANSEYVAGRLREAGVRVDGFVWNGTRIPGRPATREAVPTVAYAGRLVREKGVDWFLRAAARVVRERPRTVFIVAGDGPARLSLERLTRALVIEKNVTFTGHLSRGVLDRRIAGAWVQVVPSLWAEPFGLVTIEAMARGTPVVATATGASSELIEDGETGLLVPPGDDEALAAAVLRLVDDPARCVAMGGRAREFAAANVSFAGFVDAVEGLYVRVLGENVPAASRPVAPSQSFTGAPAAAERPE